MCLITRRSCSTFEKPIPIFEEPDHLRSSAPRNEKPVEPKTRTYVSQAGRVGAAHGQAAGWGGAGQDGTPTNRFAQGTTVSSTRQGIEHTCPERLFRSTNKRNPM